MARRVRVFKIFFMGIEDGNLIFSSQIKLFFCNLGPREQNVQPNNINYSATPPSSTPSTKRNMFLELREEKKAPPPVKTKGIDQFCKNHIIQAFFLIYSFVQLDSLMIATLTVIQMMILRMMMMVCLPYS